MAKGGLKSILNTVGKVNPFATSMDQESISKVPYFISTGNYALNAKISADLFKGIAGGRITTIFGPSQSGKSLLSAHLQKNAQEMGITPIIFDSEFDKDGRMEKSIGVNIEEVATIPVNTVEDVIVQMGKTFDKIIENEEFGKYIVILDSLGALGTSKLEDDIKKNKVAQDMGAKAKLIKALFNTMKAKTAISKCALVVLNHDMEDPNQMYESIFKKWPGGKAVEFFSTTMMYISAKKEKKTDDEGDEVLADAKGGYSGQTIRFFTQKNRLALPHLECETYLNFITGWNSYSGLKDIAINLGIIRPSGKTYEMKNDKGEWESIGYQKTWKYDAKFWKEKVFPVLNPIINEEYAYRPIDLFGEDEKK
jgi:RecA/RadA recombinase